MPPVPDRSSAKRRPAAVILTVALATLSIPPLMLFVDRPVALAMETLPGWFRSPAGDITWLGKSLGWLLLSGVLALFWAWRARRAEHGSPLGSRERKRAFAAAFLFATVALAGILTNLIKLLVGRSRPNSFLHEGIYEFRPWHLAADLRGFPSGHATTVFALAFAFAMIQPRWRLPAFAVAIVIAATRVIINAHFLSDVVGGMVVALLTAVWLRSIFERRGWRFAGEADG
ncbi:phosphatase PAP2 family protein [Hypericibacter sp.]|uniref:phosphatase PAP2 family protein n=1 Tax=Hypericibacter sp. TaxID=2705401 RepID=UPI003D6D272A